MKHPETASCQTQPSACSFGGETGAVEDVSGPQSANSATMELMRAMIGPPRPAAVPEVELASPAIVLGELAGFADDGVALVRLPAHPDLVRVRSIVELTSKLIGREVLVVHDSAQAGTPIVMGVLWQAQARPETVSAPSTTPFEFELDGEKVILSGRQQLVLRCGDASITLTKEGKILLRGKYVSSKSSGVHRILGAVVEIN